MADYASLWTSSSDKEFRQMSKYHSLESRRLGLQMAGILKEHARHVKRVRVEMRESGTLVRQYEDEKERRARHLLTMFSKVHRKRQAAQDWISAYNNRSSEVATPGMTFDVEIGAESAPYWRPDRSGSRRESKDSQFSFRRNSNVSTSSSQEAGTPTWRRPSLVNAARRSRRRSSSVLSPQPPPGRRQSGVSSVGSSAGMLPPIGAGGGYLSPTLSRLRSSAGGFSGFLNKWQSSVNGHLKDPSIPSEDEEDNDNYTDSFHHRQNYNRRRRRSRRLDSCDDGVGDMYVTVPKLRNRPIFWTQTFPFLYHSVGENACPRYLHLFHQHEEYKVDPARKKSKPSKRSMSLSATMEAEDKERTVSNHRPSFRSLTKALGAVQSLTAHFTPAAGK